MRGRITWTHSRPDAGERLKRLTTIVTDICFDDMLICMRTTLNLDDSIVRALKREALNSGRTMTEVIESSLRETLFRKRSAAQKPFRLGMVTIKGSVNPGVDLTDRDNLLDAMEGRS